MTDPADPTGPTDPLDPVRPTPGGAPEGASDWDPLAAGRGPEDPPLDVLLSGTVFFDIVFTGLSRLPEPGEELWAKGMGSSPGGIANLAIAAARLGLRTGLVAGFGDDAYADWMWHTMAHEEGIDLSASRRFPDFHSALTASVSARGDRTMVTHGHDLPEPLSALIARAPRARAAVVDLAGETAWWADLARDGTLVFADIGFDATGAWDAADLDPLVHCHAFTPNALEAMAYTRTESPDRAVRALAERVPLAVVTDGAEGAYAIDASTGRSPSAPRFPWPPWTPRGPATCSLPRWCWAPWPAGRSPSGSSSAPCAPPSPSSSSADRSPPPAGATSPTGGASSARPPTAATCAPPTPGTATASSTTWSPPIPCSAAAAPRAPSPSAPTPGSTDPEHRPVPPPPPLHQVIPGVLPIIRYGEFTPSRGPPGLDRFPVPGAAPRRARTTDVGSTGDEERQGDGGRPEPLPGTGGSGAPDPRPRRDLDDLRGGGSVVPSARGRRRVTVGSRNPPPPRPGPLRSAVGAQPVAAVRRLSSELQRSG